MSTCRAGFYRTYWIVSSLSTNNVANELDQLGTLFTNTKREHNPAEEFIHVRISSRLFNDRFDHIKTRFRQCLNSKRGEPVIPDDRLNAHGLIRKFNFFFGEKIRPGRNRQVIRKRYHRPDRRIC